MTNDNGLIELAGQKAASILETFPEKMVYHNLNHTQQVVEAINELSVNANLDSDNHEVALLAGWFHDTGFVESYENHEQYSCKIAEDFLRENECPEDKIEAVKNCIRATHLNKEPESLPEKVVCDADFYHLSSEGYFDRDQMLRREWELNLGKQYSDYEWNEKNLEFLSNHQYRTEYGKAVLENKKQKNLKKLKKAHKKLKKQQDQILGADLGVDENQLKDLKKKLKKVEGRPDRGVETMFRVTSRNHIDLSSMADNKANILISVNSIIISIMIGALASKLDSNPHLIVPTFFLVTVNAITIVFAILATRPNVTKGTFTKQDIKEKRANLLFFGNFHQMKQDDYKWGMFEVMRDHDYLYSSLIDDIYFNGRVLGKKYKYLRIAYNIFMYGIILAVLIFLAIGYFTFYR